MIHPSKKSLLQQYVTVCYLALMALALLWTNSAQALAPAGHEIKNKATVTYQDSLGNEYTTVSNESVVTVAEIYGGTLEADRKTNAAPGQTVYFSHQLINNGNTDDKFNLALSDRAGSNFTNLKVYLDSNGDGLPSSGEPELMATSDVPVERGGTVNLVVAAMVSTLAAAGDTPTLSLVAVPVRRPAGASKVDGKLTNTDIVTVTEGTALQVNKQVISHRPATISTPGKVIYRVQLTNNGAELTAGGVYDFFPDYVILDDLNGTSTADTRLGNIDIKSADGLKAELPPGTTFNPYNNNANGLYVAITELKSGASASLEFTISYPTGISPMHFAAGESMHNRAWVGYGDHSSGAWALANESNMTTVVLPQLLGVSAKNHDNSSQEESLASASAGAEAEFINTITNLGNGDDAFNLTVSNVSTGGFPADTQFTLWDESGKFQLTDSNGDGIPDTGLLVSPMVGTGNQIKIMVRAKLPGNVPGSGPYLAELTAESVLDNRISDTVTEKLGAITPASIDLANYPATSDRIVFNGEVTAIGDFFKKDASDDYDPVDKISSVISRNADDPARFGLYIANRSAISDSFGLSYDMADPSVKVARTRWQVTFRDAGIFDRDGNELAPASGAVITSTPLLPAMTVMKVEAVVELAGNTSDMPAGDYDITFTATARASGMGNSTTDRLTLLSESLLTFTPDGEGQVEAGNYIEYQHTLANNGNTSLNIAITPSAGFTPEAGWSYSVRDSLGNMINTDDDQTDLTLKPGTDASLSVRITAEATLPPGSLFTLPLEARGRIAGTSEVTVIARVTDTTRVLSPSEARVTSDKMVAPVNNDDGTYGTFSEVLADAVAPGRKVAWRVTSTNTSVGVAENVIIFDQAPPFTRLATDGGTPGNPRINGAAAPDSQVNVSGSKITFYVGDGADKGRPAKPGGSLPAGSSVEVTFEVEIEN